MTTTYDPFHPKYFDEADLRHELDRVYDLCHGCRLCFKFCASFPTLFDFIDSKPDQDASLMSPAEQDQVVAECFQCKLCYINCPYTPDQHEWALDFPRLMMRADQVKYRHHKRTLRTRLTDMALASTDTIGKVGSVTAAVANRTLEPGSRPRKMMEKATGIAAVRILPPFSKERFSTWFRKRLAGGRHRLVGARQGVVALFPTCQVEYHNVGIGHDLVKVCERNGIECRLPEGQVCCGAPHLHQGNVGAFTDQARTNIKVLAAAIRAADRVGEHLEVVVPQPTCGYVLKKDYVDYVGGDDARLVAERTRDLAEYLVAVHKADATSLDTDFPGAPSTITYHAPCHLRAQNIGLRSRDLMKLTGAKVTVVAECSGIDGTWGLRAENLDSSRQVAKKLVDAIGRAHGDAVTGDCSLANGAIALETGTDPMHPIQLVARAYGIAPEPGAERPKG